MSPSKTLKHTFLTREHEGVEVAALDGGVARLTSALQCRKLARSHGHLWSSLSPQPQLAALAHAAAITELIESRANAAAAAGGSGGRAQEGQWHTAERHAPWTICMTPATARVARGAQLGTRWAKS